MNNHFIKLASIICIALLLIIVGEWAFAHLSEQQLLESSAIKAQTAPADEMPSINLTEQPEESYTDLVERPLFITGRRPVDEPASSTSPMQTVTGGMPANFDWQLSGVYTKDKRLFALFSHAKVKLPKAKDNFRKLSVGELDDKGNLKTLDGWQVSDIKLDRVILKQSANEKELLLRKPKPKELPPANPAEAGPEGAPAPEGTPMPDGSLAPDAIPEDQPMPEPETDPTTQAPQGDFENSNAHF
ncbi:MAG: hypothetical protein WAX77_09915 [Methylococcaceae bacterium]